MLHVCSTPKKAKKHTANTIDEEHKIITHEETQQSPVKIKQNINNFIVINSNFCCYNMFSKLNYVHTVVESEDEWGKSFSSGEERLGHDIIHSSIVSYFAAVGVSFYLLLFFLLFMIAIIQRKIRKKMTKSP